MRSIPPPPKSTKKKVSSLISLCHHVDRNLRASSFEEGGTDVRKQRHISRPNNGPGRSTNRPLDRPGNSKDQPTTEERTIGQSIDPEKKSKSKSSD